MNEPAWLERETLLLLHSSSIARFGGAEGVRDPGLLESALARPQNLFAHEKVTDLADLAAAYAFGLIRNHPFVDGNKRIAFLAVGIFLDMNDAALDPETADAISAVMALAEGSIGDREFAAWIRANLR